MLIRIRAFHKELSRVWIMRRYVGLVDLHILGHALVDAGLRGGRRGVKQEETSKTSAEP